MPEGESKSKAIREWIAGLLLPVAIFAYTLSKDRADEQQRELDRVATIIKSLGSTSEAERSLARSYITYLSRHNEAPQEALDLLQANYATASTPAESAAIRQTIETVQQQDTKQAPNTPSVVNNLPYKVFLQIRDNDDRPTAVLVQRALIANNILAPGIELVADHGPDKNTVFYFHPEDLKEAQTISKKLTDAGIPAEPVDGSQYTSFKAISVPQRQLEIWLIKGAKPTSNQ
ncbi:hypothetical protein [Granulicella sibirica]|uniref:Uncharacterized protein n=1 Tax=Granulicella sibirica TaxID=2479048 RepID=A0A4Q0T6B3_9BACT|nr:hypothetical protein [Granulicella sibirica]RXH57111.1 hypothetical protein GRAN_0421 [Granulicella sibirica]